MADDDVRDERLGRLLEVEPLDEVARRRLVTKAMRASAPPARSRLVAAAAAVAIVVAGGIGYLALRGNDSTAPSASSVEPSATAAGGSSSSTAAPTAGTRASDSNNSNSDTTAPGAAAGVASPRDLGDVGDLDDATNVDRLRASTGSSFSANTQGPAGAQDNPASGGAALVARLRALACAGELPDGTILAIGTGHFGTHDAIVVETSLPDGTTSLNAVVTHPCRVRPLD